MSKKGYLAKKEIEYIVVFIGGTWTKISVPMGSDMLRTLIRGGRVVSYKRA